MMLAEQTEETYPELSNLMRELGRAQREKNKANLDRNSAEFERDQAILERDQARRDLDILKEEYQQKTKGTGERGELRTVEVRT